MSRRTKIICTIGPATNRPEMIRELIRRGMNVARLNFSHGTHDAHRAVYGMIRAESAALGANVAILMDLQGPKIRTGPLAGGQPVELIPGAQFTITTREAPGDAACVSTTYEHMPEDVRPGDRVLLADGAFELRVLSASPPDVLCEVVRGGMLGAKKGINLPGVTINEPSVTEKDLADLAFGLELGVDFVALSFVRSADDVRQVKEIVTRAGARAGVIAKIERPEAILDFDGIVATSDAIMVARGDLGVEMPYEEVPAIQKRLIQTCNEQAVPVITATQMLESMIGSPRPTRAEVGDVANAIYDGTDAVMLSGETASGAYPLEAVETMARVAERVDVEAAASPPAERIVRLRASSLHTVKKSCRLDAGPRENLYADAIGQAVTRMTDAMDVKRIVCFTTSGYTATAIAQYRPRVPITAITNSAKTMRRCALMWGVDAILSEDFHRIDTMVARVEQLLIEHGQVQRGDTIILVAGTPLVVAGRTNLLKLHAIGEADALHQL